VNSSDDIQLHDLESIEENLSTEHDEEAEDCFMIGSASGFMIGSASGFMIGSASGFMIGSASGFMIG
jgi:hypothetical protein